MYTGLSLYYGVIMTTNDILQLDCRDERNARIIQKALRRIKQLSNVDEDIIPINLLELCIKKYCNKYKYYYRLYPDTTAADNYIVWKGMVLSIDDLSVIGSVYGCTVYEVFSKTIIKLYSVTKGGR